MKSFKYTINGNVYKVHISSVVDGQAECQAWKQAGFQV